ncbi:hypothetical protein BJY52DRAFT_1309340 [Lactarius psammicola]|nr:hypothetical protein BJY52DRAFT_1309340 [Lactarius psammicola]
MGEFIDGSNEQTVRRRQKFLGWFGRKQRLTRERCVICYVSATTTNDPKDGRFVIDLLLLLLSMVSESLCLCVLVLCVCACARAWPEGQTQARQRGQAAELCRAANWPRYLMPVKAHRGLRPFYSSLFIKPPHSSSRIHLGNIGTIFFFAQCQCPLTAGFVSCGSKRRNDNRLAHTHCCQDTQSSIGIIRVFCTIFACPPNNVYKRCKETKKSTFLLLYCK